MQLLPMASSPDGLISAPVCGHYEDPRLGGAHHNQRREGGGGGGILMFQKLQRWQNPEPDPKGVRVLMPGKDEHRTIISWVAVLHTWP